MEIVLVLCELDMVVLFIWFLLQDQDPMIFGGKVHQPPTPLPSTTIAPMKSLSAAPSMKKQFFRWLSNTRYTKRVAFVTILMIAASQFLHLSSVTFLNSNLAKSYNSIPCFKSPMTLAIGIGGKDCTSRLTSIIRLRMLLYSLEQDETPDNRSSRRNLVHIQLWLNSDDNTTLPLVNQITSDMDHVASVTAIDIGNSTALTDQNSPPICPCFIYRPYDWVKFWGIHQNNPHRYILNIDVDTVFTRPLSLLEVWNDGCQKLLDSPESFYVATRETLDEIGILDVFTRYINSGVVFLDLHRRNEAYNRSVLTNYIIPNVHENKTLQAKGTWPPEQWLWNSIFHRYPNYLAIFNDSTSCNCATHKLYPGGDECKLAHYCNTPVPLLFNASGGIASDLLPFSSSLADYIRESRPRLYSKVVSAEMLDCPVSS